MSTIRRRLEKLEKTLAPHAEEDAGWGTMARYRDLILSHAKQRGESFYEDAEKQLEAMGPSGLWSEAVRSLLKNHGFVQNGIESFAETVCRALGIKSAELNLLIQDGRLGSELVNRFQSAKVATDNGS